ncbi:MAG: hypothetical protein HC898_06870 [Phycisphaerales bacterium]|nr:hypothetical protein [Phycisphaerales bacterium]
MMWQGRTVKALGIAAVAGMLSAPAMVNAQEEAPAVNAGKVSVTLGVDWVTQYFFRGINQNNNGIIIQPYADLGFLLWEGDGPINSVSANIGLWGSFVDNHSPSALFGTPNTFQELDLYAGVSVGFLDDFKLSVVYQNYKYPDLGGRTQTQELILKLAYDDSELMGPFTMNPYVLYAVEIDDTVGAGNAIAGDEGQYAELGIAPSMTIFESEDYPITLTLPMAAGFSIDGYYVDNTFGDNELWGFVSVGAMFSTPLSFIPADYGSWTLTAGPQVLFLNGDANNGMVNGSDVVFLAKMGISMAY